MNKNISSIGFPFLRSDVWHHKNCIHMHVCDTETIYMCVCNCKTKLFKDRYFILKNMSLNVKIISQSSKSPDPLILEMSSRI